VVATRQQRLMFGEVAGDYDDVRAGYPAEIADRIFGYTGGLVPVVEVGAGTGKATALWAAAGAAVTCVEPDPQMAQVLRRRSADRVRLRLCGFEDWAPPAGGVPLICSAQAFHWVDPQVRWRRAHQALSAGGVLAVFGHAYVFADGALADAVHEQAYARVAPELLRDEPDRPDTLEESLFHQEMTGCGLFADVTSTLVESVVEYPTARYLTLLGTFSDHRMLPPTRRERLHDAIGEVIERHGGVVRVRLDTVLTMGRRRD
jgi:SAM-dependent methyltransferase